MLTFLTLYCETICSKLNHSGIWLKPEWYPDKSAPPVTLLQFADDEKGKLNRFPASPQFTGQVERSDTHYVVASSS